MYPIPLKIQEMTLSCLNENMVMCFSLVLRAYFIFDITLKNYPHSVLLTCSAHLEEEYLVLHEFGRVLRNQYERERNSMG